MRGFVFKLSCNGGPVFNNSLNNWIVRCRFRNQRSAVCPVTEPYAKCIWVKRKIRFLPDNRRVWGEQIHIPMPTRVRLPGFNDRPLDFFCFKRLIAVPVPVEHHPFVVFVTLDFFAVGKFNQAIQHTFRMNCNNFFELSVKADNLVSDDKIPVFFPPVFGQYRRIICQGLAYTRR